MLKSEAFDNNSFISGFFVLKSSILVKDMFYNIKLHKLSKCNFSRAYLFEQGSGRNEF